MFNECVHQLIEQQVEKTPAAIAVMVNEKKITYLDLNQKANQLARYLQATFDLQANDFVAIHIANSIETVIALLAVLNPG